MAVSTLFHGPISDRLGGRPVPHTDGSAPPGTLAICLPTSFGAFAQGMALPNTHAAFVNVDLQAAGAASGLSGTGGTGGRRDPGRHSLPNGDRHGRLRHGGVGLGPRGDAI